MAARESTAEGAARQLPDGLAPSPAAGSKPFRFFDNREKYLLFVTTCSEKSAIAERIGREIPRLRPRLPALRVFDAGMGDATVLTRTLRSLHRAHPTVPFFVVGKEISLEDVRLSLEKMADRFFEHPQTVLAVTNLYYSEAPWLKPGAGTDALPLNWLEVPLEGTTSHEFDQQIRALQGQLAPLWRTRISGRTGNPLYAEPSVIVLYRKDHRFILDPLIPDRSGIPADYDLVIASQPFRARSSAEIKVRNVLAPLARALGPDGRMVVIQSTGRDPGMEIINALWPDERPFRTPAFALISQLESALGGDRRRFQFDDASGEDGLFRFQLHALPEELGSNIGTSTLLAGWNAAIYVAQIPDSQLTEVLGRGGYLEATREVLCRHGGLWFIDECFVVSRGGA